MIQSKDKKHNLLKFSKEKLLRGQQNINNVSEFRFNFRTPQPNKIRNEH